MSVAPDARTGAAASSGRKSRCARDSEAAPAVDRLDCGFGFFDAEDADDVSESD
jgi:hypothetical protein